MTDHLPETIEVESDGQTLTFEKVEDITYSQHMEYEGMVFEPQFQVVHECEHCGNKWVTRSSERRPSCSACHSRTDRKIVGGYYEEYLKYSLFTGNEDSGEEVVDTLHLRGDLYDAMLDNGWRFSQTTQSSHVLFVSGDVDEDDFEIIA